MQLSAPFKYQIQFPQNEITSVRTMNGDEVRKGSSSSFTKPGPKLYVISRNQKPIYVGVTTERIRSRLNKGFKDMYGYQWGCLGKANIDLWMLTGADQRTLETVEGEVAFLIRQVSGHWPKYQIEIHFHQSNDEHREAAQKIVSCYVGASCPTS